MRWLSLNFQIPHSDTNIIKLIVTFLPNVFELRF